MGTLLLGVDNLLFGDCVTKIHPLLVPKQDLVKRVKFKSRNVSSYCLCMFVLGILHIITSITVTLYKSPSGPRIVTLLGDSVLLFPSLVLVDVRRSS